MKAVLFANAVINDYRCCQQYLEENPFIICCDGGVRHTKAMGILPNVILGDFDSAPQDILNEYKLKEIPIVQFPAHKDETDMELGLLYAMEQGATDIVIFGGIGSRLDHTLSNIHLLYMALKRKVRARLVNENNCAELVDEKIVLHGNAGDIISVLPMTLSVKGISNKGLEYPLQDATLHLESPRGVSNVMLEKMAEISIKEGLILVIVTKD